LTKTENTTIGITGIVKGLSGGEKRRLTFATEVRRKELDGYDELYERFLPDHQ
jgi:hypothetical protein